MDPAYNIDSGDGDTNQARARVDEADPYGTTFDHPQVFSESGGIYFQNQNSGGDDYGPPQGG
jgi:hypothetical protein